MAGSCYGSAMARKASVNWSRKLPAPIVPLDGEPMRTLREVVLYMDAIGAGRQSRQAWRRAAELLLDAAERNGSVADVRRQVMLALILDVRLDVQATAPAK